AERPARRRRADGTHESEHRGDADAEQADGSARNRFENHARDRGEEEGEEAPRVQRQAVWHRREEHGAADDEWRERAEGDRLPRARADAGRCSRYGDETRTHGSGQFTTVVAFPGMRLLSSCAL